MTARHAPRRGGFTLIELLVAVFLLAVLSAFAYGTLSYVQKAREATQTNFAREREVELAVHTLATDFEQLAPRPVRQPLGTEYLGAIVADPRSPDLVAFTRLGWSNSAGLPRSTMQRVSYRYDKDRHVLVRAYTNVLDAPLSTTPVARDLLTQVDSVTLRFLPAGPPTPALPGTPGSAGAAAGAGVASAPVPLSGDVLSAAWVTQWPATGVNTVLPATGPGPGTGAAAKAAAGSPNPDATAVDPVLPRTRPRAVEITLVLTDYGRIVRLVEVPG